MNILTSSYKKALKVIDSCENETQLEGAKKYINNFFLYFATQKNSSMGKIFKVPETISAAYQRLLIKHAEKGATL